MDVAGGSREHGRALGGCTASRKHEMRGACGAGTTRAAGVAVVVGQQQHKVALLHYCVHV